jgi:starch synthase
MKILFAASEAVPFAKTGGLADVAGVLPKAFARLGHEVKLIMPLYRKIDKNQFSLVAGPTTKVKLGSVEHNVTFYTAANPGLSMEVVFVDIPELFDRDELYQELGVEYPDNFERFISFCLAVREYPAVSGFAPDILHLHDWHTAALPVLVREPKVAPGFENTATVLTIHNLAYQGIFPKEKLSLLDLPPDGFEHLGFNFWDQVNLLKAGILNSDLLTTVSPRYADEIQTMEFGCGLEGFLRSRAQNLFGVINGIDKDEWNPATDREISYQYSATDLRPKVLCKSFLQDEMGLSVDNHVPLIGIVGRLTDQKGFDLVADVMRDFLGEGFQLVILGTGDPNYHKMLEELKHLYPNNVGLKLGFDNRLARLIYSGSDMFLMPSRFEPCGLGQMISMAYATIPIVRATGGLADTVVDADADPVGGYGFVFHEYTSVALSQTIHRARTAFEDKSRWNMLMERAITKDFGWEVSAKRYIELFERAIITRS